MGLQISTYWKDSRKQIVIIIITTTTTIPLIIIMVPVHFLSCFTSINIRHTIQLQPENDAKEGSL